LRSDVDIGAGRAEVEPGAASGAKKAGRRGDGSLYFSDIRANRTYLLKTGGNEVSSI
jgi:hypothetical protein